MRQANNGRSWVKVAGAIATVAIEVWRQTQQGQGKPKK